MKNKNAATSAALDLSIFAGGHIYLINFLTSLNL